MGSKTLRKEKLASEQRDLTKMQELENDNLMKIKRPCRPYIKLFLGLSKMKNMHLYKPKMG